MKGIFILILIFLIFVVTSKEQFASNDSLTMSFSTNETSIEGQLFDNQNQSLGQFDIFQNTPQRVTVPLGGKIGFYVPNTPSGHVRYYSYDELKNLNSNLVIDKCLFLN